MLIALERESETANRSMLEPRIAAEGVPYSWLDTTDYLEPALEKAAALADIVVVNLADPDRCTADERALAGSLALKAGKPVLAVPNQSRGFDAAGAALVAWDGLNRPGFVEAFDADLPIEAYLSQMRQTVSVVCIGLVCSHIESGLGMARVYADRGQTIRSERMVKPNRQRSGLKYHTFCIRRALADHFCEQLWVGCTLAAPNALAVVAP